MTKKTNKKISFRKSLQRLEEIVEKLQDPDCELEDSLKLLEEGLQIHKECKEKLDTTEVRINKILKKEETIYSPRENSQD